MVKAVYSSSSNKKIDIQNKTDKIQTELTPALDMNSPKIELSKLSVIKEEPKKIEGNRSSRVI